MNTPNVNAPGSGNPLENNRPISKRREIQRSDAASDDQSSASSVRDNDQSGTVPSSADAFQSTRDREFVREMVQQAEQDNAPVREEAVARAKQRVSEGYYDSQEFLGNLASRLINTSQ